MYENKKEILLCKNGFSKRKNTGFVEVFDELMFVVFENNLKGDYYNG